MANNLKIFIKKNWHWLLFLLMVFIALSFLLFQGGIWAFGDSGFFYNNILQTQKIAFSKLSQFSRTDGFYFGFDNSASNFSHLIINFYQLILTFIFGANVGQVLYYFIYYFICFYFGKKLLEKLFCQLGQLEIRIGALFLAFNPFSLLIISLFIVGYIYAFFIVFIYFFFNYLEEGKISDLTVSAFFSVCLISYLRIAPIVALTVVFFIFIFNNRFFNLKRLIIFGVIFLLCAGPFFVNNLFSLADSGNVVINYEDAFSKYEKANYQFKQSFVNSFSHPGGFTPSALSFCYNNRGIPDFFDNFALKSSLEFYKIIQLLFNVGILILALYFLKNLRDLKVLILLLFTIFINTLGFFFNFDWFSKINRSIFLFLYNDYGFFQFIQSFLFSFLIVSLIFAVKNSKKHRDKLVILISLILIYLFINLTPFLSGHYGFEKIKNIPINYQEKFINEDEYDFAQASIFAPYYWLNFHWSPYYLSLNTFFYSKYQTLVVPNLRLIGTDFADFYNNVYENIDKEEFSNLAVFNFKNVFVFHDVVDANSNIDTYQVINIEDNSRKINKDLIEKKDFSIVSKNENFTHYRFPNADGYDFFIYSPKYLFNLGLTNFYKEKFDFSQKPVVINKSELNKLNLISDVNFRLNSPHISVKMSQDNPNKYYLKLNVNKNYPFLIQFNQMFSRFWGVYFIDEQEWASVECKTDWQEFKLTENSRCRYENSPLNFKDLSLLSKKYLKSGNQFKGNIIGNTFLITPNDIPKIHQETDELYLVIYFRKQFYYLITIAVSFITFTILLALSGFRLWQKNQYEK